MLSPPPQKTQGLEGGKPRWVDSFLTSEVCPILSETFLGCWKLLLLDFYGSLPEVNDWQGHLSSLLTLGFRIGMTIYGSKYCHLPSLIRFAGLLHWHTAGVSCGFVSSLQGRQGGEGFGQWWSNLLRIRITKELFEWNMLDWKKKSRESLGLWESGFLLVFEHFVGVCCCHHDLFGFFVSPPTKNVTRLRNLVILMWRLRTNGRTTSGESINQLAGEGG